jgi:uncharacterized cupin superfamily protein
MRAIDCRCGHHLEHGNEEWLLVVSGRPTLRHPSGEQELARGDVVCFGRGPDGGHQVINRSDAAARILVLSTMNFPHVVDYPDSGKVLGGQVIEPAVNLFADEWDEERDRSGFRYRFAKIGERVGGELLGAALFELPPGQRTLYHLHHGNEELLVVLAGRPTLRTAEGARELGEGDVAIFTRGEAHGIASRSGETVRFLFVSTMLHPDVVEYPDSGKVGVFAGAAPRMGSDAPLEIFLPRDAELDYYDGEKPSY